MRLPIHFLQEERNSWGLYAIARMRDKQNKLVFCAMSGLRQNFKTVGDLSSFPQHRRHGTIFHLAQLDGIASRFLLDASRQPETTTSSEVSLWRFLARIITTSTDVHAPRAPSSISIGPGAALCSRSASNGTEWPEGILATNSSPAIHLTIAVCKISSA
jgi:hypothetical protein